MDNKKEKITLHASVVNTEASEEIIALAKTRGIDLPHPALASFSSVLCAIEEPNENGIRLGREGTIEALTSLIGTQVNFNHERRGNICGYIFDSRLNSSDQVEISCVYFKHIYYSEYEEAMDLFSDGDLTMSFELTHDKDTQEVLEDGTRRINNFFFTGAGLLLGKSPAYDEAIVYEFAQKELECVFAQKEPKIMKTIESLYAKANSKLVKAFADVVEEKDVNFELASKFNCATDEEKQLLSEDAQKWTINYINNLENAQEAKKTMDLKEKKEALIAELGVEITKDWTDEDFANEEKVVEARKVAEEAKTTYTTDKNEKVTEVYDEDSVLTIVEGEVVYSYENDAGEKSTTTKKYANQEIYLYASVEKIKANYETQIAELKATLEAKDSEIEEVRANAEKIGKLKIELSDNEFASDFSNEDFLNEEKVEEAKKAKADALVIAEKKEELKDNEFAVDFSDADYLNADKVELAKLKKDVEVAKVTPAPVENKDDLEASNEDLDAGTSIKVETEPGALKRLMQNRTKQNNK